MLDPREATILAEGGHASLREIQAQLTRAGIASEIVRPPPEKCSS